MRQRPRRYRVEWTRQDGRSFNETFAGEKRTADSVARLQARGISANVVPVSASHRARAHTRRIRSARFFDPMELSEWSNVEGLYPDSPTLKLNARETAYRSHFPTRPIPRRLRRVE